MTDVTPAPETARTEARDQPSQPRPSSESAGPSSVSTTAPAAAIVRPLRNAPSWVLLLGLALLGAAAYIYVPGIFYVETDDAYVQADAVTITPKVAAYVKALGITDNSAFSKDELLVQLDPRDFQAAVNTATANVQVAEAARDNAAAQLSEQSQTVAADAAQVAGDRATVTFAKQQVTRFGALAETGAGTTEDLQQAEANIGVQAATMQHDLATLSAAETQTSVLRTQVQEAAASVAHAKSLLAQAELNLTYTKIYAPVSGTVANRIVQVGDFVQPGQTLFSAVPNQVYVVANFKETQLSRMRPGQAVWISVDALRGTVLRGHVDSFQRGTGSYFALLPPENATGNFVKIVQRIPIKIFLDSSSGSISPLSPGMSVEVSVDVKQTPHILADIFQVW